VEVGGAERVWAGKIEEERRIRREAVTPEMPEK
jgi:hypothetical protein